METDFTKMSSPKRAFKSELALPYEVLYAASWPSISSEKRPRISVLGQFCCVSESLVHVNKNGDSPIFRTRILSELKSPYNLGILLRNIHSQPLGFLALVKENSIVNWWLTRRAPGYCLTWISVKKKRKKIEFGREINVEYQYDFTEKCLWNTVWKIQKFTLTLFWQKLQNA